MYQLEKQIMNSKLQQLSLPNVNILYQNFPKSKLIFDVRSQEQLLVFITERNYECIVFPLGVFSGIWNVVSSSGYMSRVHVLMIQVLFCMYAVLQ